MPTNDRSEDWKAKIDHHLRALFEREKDNPDAANQLIRVVLRVAADVDAARLDVPGFQPGSVAGDIMTGSLFLSDVPAVASAPDILFIELSVPYGPDAGPPVADEDMGTTDEDVV